MSRISKSLFALLVSILGLCSSGFGATTAARREPWDSTSGTSAQVSQSLVPITEIRADFLVWGGGRTKAKAQRSLAQLIARNSERARNKRIVFATGFPRIVRSDDHPGMNSGFYVVVAGICRVGTAETALQRLQQLKKSAYSKTAVTTEFGCTGRVVSSPQDVSVSTDSDQALITRLQAIAELALRTDDEARSTLRSLMGDEDPNIRIAAHAAFAGDDSVDHLVRIARKRTLSEILQTPRNLGALIERGRDIQLIAKVAQTIETSPGSVKLSDFEQGVRKHLQDAFSRLVQDESLSVRRLVLQAALHPIDPRTWWLARLTRDDDDELRRTALKRVVGISNESLYQSVVESWQGKIARRFSSRDFVALLDAGTTLNDEQKATMFVGFVRNLLWQMHRESNAASEQSTSKGPFCRFAIAAAETGSYLADRIFVDMIHGIRSENVCVATSLAKIGTCRAYGLMGRASVELPGRISREVLEAVGKIKTSAGRCAMTWLREHSGGLDASSIRRSTDVSSCDSCRELWTLGPERPREESKKLLAQTRRKIVDLSRAGWKLDPVFPRLVDGQASASARLELGTCSSQTPLRDIVGIHQIFPELRVEWVSSRSMGCPRFRSESRQSPTKAEMCRTLMIAASDDAPFDLTDVPIWNDRDDYGSYALEVNVESLRDAVEVYCKERYPPAFSGGGWTCVELDASHNAKYDGGNELKTFYGEKSEIWCTALAQPPIFLETYKYLWSTTQISYDLCGESSCDAMKFRSQYRFVDSTAPLLCLRYKSKSYSANEDDCSEDTYDDDVEEHVCSEPVLELNDSGRRAYRFTPTGFKEMDGWPAKCKGVFRSL